MTGRGDPGGTPRYWMGMCLDDQLVTDEALDRMIGLGARWPEPRALDQVGVFHLEDRTAVEVPFLDDRNVEDLLRLLVLLAADLHEVASCDDESTTSSALEWALDETGVLPVHALEPLVWLESTVLVRHLRQRQGAASDGTGRA